MENSTETEDLRSDTDSESSFELQCDVSAELDDNEGDENVIEPYRFEPYLESDEEQNSEASSSEGQNVPMEQQVAGPQNDEGRLHNTEWCVCGKCQTMPTAQESVCCHEFERVVAKKNTQPDINCITDHEDFADGCLRRVVLEIAYYGDRHAYGPIPAGNDWKRYTAYRQFIRWCYHYLGRKIRVPIPSCVVNKVRSTFPADQYTGFKNAPNEGD